MRDAFNNLKYSPADLFSDQKVTNTIKTLLYQWLRFLGRSDEEARRLMTETMLSCLRSTPVSEDLEEDLIAKYDQLNTVKTMISKMGGRADLLFGYISPHLPKDLVRSNYKVLDIGTGPAKVGKKFHEESFDVRLQDIIGDGKEKRAPDVIELVKAGKLPYDLDKNNVPLRYSDNTYNLTLLMTVLHHCNDPMQVLREAIRVTKRKGKIAILESTYSVDQSELPDEVYTEYPELYDAFFGLGKDGQKKYGTFLDWFLNKMSFKNNANVPCNFNSPSGWEKIFHENGLRVLEKRVVGIDQMVTPEFHVFYMLEKI
ncbi:MAG: methyltransferase domain-containing protein [Nanoarchaeota archaeon]|nr:methyltransferase domain-containing protein [Nanoarchaeota archaeon]